MRIPKVAVIDTGINPNWVPAEVSFDNYDIVNKGLVKAVSHDPEPSYPHATYCYITFREQVDVPYHLISINTFDENTNTNTFNKIIIALEWCAQNSIDLVLMSLGTKNYTLFPKVAKAINALPNTIVVAACCNSNTITYPACLPNVIGVRHCDVAELSDGFAYITDAYDNIDVLTCVPNASNSIAVPTIAAHICRYIAEGAEGIDAIRQKLKENAVPECSLKNMRFYKDLLKNWSKIEIPIISLPESIPGGADKVKELMQAYVQTGYKAVCLSNIWNTSSQDFIFGLSLGDRLRFHFEHMTYEDEESSRISTEAALPDLIELYYNYTAPNILFLHMDQDVALELPVHVRPNILIGEDWIEAEVVHLQEKIGELILELVSDDFVSDDVDIAC